LNWRPFSNRDSRAEEKVHEFRCVENPAQTAQAGGASAVYLSDDGNGSGVKLLEILGRYWTGFSTACSSQARFKSFFSFPSMALSPMCSSCRMASASMVNGAKA
jgi:hypothetical protein